MEQVNNCSVCNFFLNLVALGLGKRCKLTNDFIPESKTCENFELIIEKDNE